MFSWVDAVRGAAAVLTADSQASTLPVQNLADRIIQKVWRSLITTSGFGVDFGANVPISVLGLFGCTLASTDTVQHRLSTVSLGGTDVLDTGAVACNVQARYNQHIYLPNGAPLTARYWRCDIVATSRVSLGYFDIGRAVAGDIWSPSINVDYGWSQNWQDDASISRALRSGVKFTADGPLYRKRTVTFSALTDADLAQAMEMDAACGTRGQLLFIPDSAGSPNTDAILGSMLPGGSAASSGSVSPQIYQQSPIAQPTDSFPARYSKTYTIVQDL